MHALVSVRVCVFFCACVYVCVREEFACDCIYKTIFCLPIRCVRAGACVRVRARLHVCAREERF